LNLLDEDGYFTDDHGKHRTPRAATKMNFYKGALRTVTKMMEIEY
jgi:hypothetical protein